MQCRRARNEVEECRRGGRLRTRKRELQRRGEPEPGPTEASDRDPGAAGSGDEVLEVVQHQKVVRRTSEEGV